MSQIELNQSTKAGIDGSGWNGLYKVGGVAALMQLACVLVIFIVSFALGPKPNIASEYYALLQANKFTGLLRSDLASLLIIALYLGTFSGICAALRRAHGAYAALATTLVFLGVTICLATDSVLSMLYLSNQYAAATTDAMRSQLLTAGEAVIASDLWHSSGGFIAGILLQGGGVLISLVMLRSKDFSKVTAYAGLVANGADLAQHIIRLFAPPIANTILIAGGSFYLVWFPMMARDLFVLGRSVSQQATEHIDQHSRESA